MLKTDKICNECDGEVILDEGIAVCLECGKDFDEDEVEGLRNA